MYVENGFLETQSLPNIAFTWLRKCVLESKPTKVWNEWLMSDTLLSFFLGCQSSQAFSDPSDKLCVDQCQAQWQDPLRLLRPHGAPGLLPGQSHGRDPALLQLDLRVNGGIRGWLWWNRYRGLWTRGTHEEHLHRYFWEGKALDQKIVKLWPSLIFACKQATSVAPPTR